MSEFKNLTGVEFGEADGAKKVRVPIQPLAVPFRTPNHSEQRVVFGNLRSSLQLGPVGGWDGLPFLQIYTKAGELVVEDQWQISLFVNKDGVDPLSGYHSGHKLGNRVVGRKGWLLPDTEYVFKFTPTFLAPDGKITFYYEGNDGNETFYGDGTPIESIAMQETLNEINGKIDDLLSR